MTEIDLRHQFGASIKSWRGRRGISQEELAGRAGLHRTYISDIERGARNVSLGSVEKLARALEVSVSTLFQQRGPDEQLAERAGLVEMLLVEDNPDDLALTLAALRQARMKNPIFTARDGAEALQFLFGSGTPASPGFRSQHLVVLLDLHLPKIGGVEVLRRMKADVRTQTIPVVVLTASQHEKDVLAMKQLGADAYLVKPLDLINLSEVTPRLSLNWALLKGEPGAD